MSHDRTLTKTDAASPGDGGAADGRARADVESGASRPTPAGPEPSFDGEGWAWATEHGAPEKASTEQLVSWLARGELPPYTLVWRAGWGEWLPAMQVAELAAAFPSVTAGSRRVAQIASDGTRTPPPVPVAHYPRLRLLARDVVGEAPVAPFAGLAPAQAGRRAFRDLDYVQKDLVTSQVPAAAMLEAARAMKRQGPLVPPGGVARWGQLDLGTFGEPPPEGSVPPQAAVPPLRTLSPLAVELGFPSLLEPEPSETPWRPSRRYGPWLAFGVLAGGVLGLFAVRGPSQQAAAPVVTTGALRAVAPPEPSEVRVVTGPCRSPLEAVRLDEWAIRDVPPAIASLSGGEKLADASAGVTLAADRVAVGYAQSHESARGIVLSPESLDFERLVARRALQPIFSVSPIVQDGALAFHAERQGASVAYARTIGVDPPLRVGMNAQGLLVGPLEEPAKKVWELPPGTVISVPAIAAHPGALTLATLVGRKQGPLRVGVMSARGEALSELGQIGDSHARFGRPALASGGGTTVLAVTARSEDGSRQSLWLSRADAGQPPLVLQPFEPMSDEPIGGGAELEAPAIAALPGGGFALLYAQGIGWKRRVLMQRLSATLAPLDAPVDVTTPDRAFRGASVGALYWVNDRLLAFHFLGRDGGFSLWVSSMECELG